MITEMEKIVTEIFNEIDKLLDKHVVMIPFQDGAYKMFFDRTLEIDFAKLKNNYRELRIVRKEVIEE